MLGVPAIVKMLPGMADTRQALMHTAGFCAHVSHSTSSTVGCPTQLVPRCKAQVSCCCCTSVHALHLADLQTVQTATVASGHPGRHAVCTTAFRNLALVPEQGKAWQEHNDIHAMLLMLV